MDLGVLDSRYRELQRTVHPDRFASEIMPASAHQLLLAGITTARDLGAPLQDSLDVRERIESGWWDGNDVARDYFVARNARGLRLWIYRELRGEQRWFLHGIFG